MNFRIKPEPPRQPASPLENLVEPLRTKVQEKIEEEVRRSLTETVNSAVKDNARGMLQKGGELLARFDNQNARGEVTGPKAEQAMWMNTVDAALSAAHGVTMPFGLGFIPGTAQVGFAGVKGVVALVEYLRGSKPSTPG